MSIGYNIEIKLFAGYTVENISKILQRGKSKDFIYYDQLPFEEQFDFREINAEQATNRVWNAYQNDLEGGPCVFAVLEKNISDVTLEFTKSDEGSLVLRASSLESTRKKEFYLDFAFYIRMLLDLVEDFAIMELKTHMF